MLDRLTDLIGQLDLPGLYALLGLVAFIEGVFPLLPGDVVVAFGSFLAARQGAELAMTIVAIVIGSTAGCAVVYGVARRYGAAWMRRKLTRFHVAGAEKKLEEMYARYGLWALFVSRFVPGFRAVGAPMAGMLRVPFFSSMAVVTLASAIWYGLIAALAFRVGTDWELLRLSVERLARRVGITAFSAVLLAAIIGWAIWKQRKFRKEALAAEAAKEAPPPAEQGPTT